MTAPSEHGFPDWGRYLPQSDKLYAQFSVMDIDALTSYGPYFVGDVPRIALEFSSGSGGFRVTLRFTQDAASTIAPRSVTSHVRSGNLSNLTYPVLGPWVRIDVTPSVVNSSWVGALYSTTAATIPYAGGGSTNVLLSLANVAVGAGVTSGATAPYVWPGRAIWNVYSTLATWTAVLYGFDYLGTQTRLDTCDNTNGKFSREVYLPYMNCRIDFTNTTGAGGAYYATLMGDPIAGG